MHSEEEDQQSRSKDCSAEDDDDGLMCTEKLPISLSPSRSLFARDLHEIATTNRTTTSTAAAAAAARPSVCHNLPIDGTTNDDGENYSDAKFNGKNVTKSNEKDNNDTIFSDSGDKSVVNDRATLGDEADDEIENNTSTNNIALNDTNVMQKKRPISKYTPSSKVEVIERKPRQKQQMEEQTQLPTVKGLSTSTKHKKTLNCDQQLIHNVASLSPTTATALQSVQPHVSSRWDLRTTCDSYRNDNSANNGNIDRMSRMTPSEIMQAIDTLHPITKPLPPNSTLLERSLIASGVIDDVYFDDGGKSSNGNGNDDNKSTEQIPTTASTSLSTSMSAPEPTVEIVNSSEGTTISGIPLATQNAHKQQTLPASSASSSPSSPSMSLPKAKSDGERYNNNQDNQQKLSGGSKRKIEMPWKALIKVYDLMHHQDLTHFNPSTNQYKCASNIESTDPDDTMNNRGHSLDHTEQTQKRQKLDFMEYKDIIARLQSIENKNRELKVRSDIIKCKGEELDLPQVMQERDYGDTIHISKFYSDNSTSKELKK